MAESLCQVCHTEVENPLVLWMQVCFDAQVRTGHQDCFDGATPLCPSCHAHVDHHCTASSCSWWRCKNPECRTYGDRRRHAQMPVPPTKEQA